MIKDLINAFKESVNELYKNDQYLIDNKLHEQSISYRIAYYIENIIKKNSKLQKYKIDVEYNKNLDTEKVIFQPCISCKNTSCKVHVKTVKNTIDKTARPDIIVHERGESNNLLIIEIKKDKKENEYDDAKLIAFTCSQNSFKYKIGIYLNITKNEIDASYVYFNKGNKSKIIHKFKIHYNN